MLRFRDRDSYAKNKTKEYDDLAMKYLTYVLLFLAACFSVYSLKYERHRSWYSWILSSLTSCVYMFGEHFDCVFSWLWCLYCYSCVAISFGSPFSFVSSLSLNHLSWYLLLVYMGHGLRYILFAWDRLISLLERFKMFTFCDSCVPYYLVPSLGVLRRMVIMNVFTWLCWVTWVETPNS